MKIFLVFLLLDFPLFKGQERAEEFEYIRLRIVFPPFYNSYNKYCCRPYPANCYKVLDNNGFTTDSLRGRVTKVEQDGWIEFFILNAQLADGGYYRCVVLGTPIYVDYHVEVSEASVHRRRSQPPLATTMKVLETSRTAPESTGPLLTQDHVDSPTAPWSSSVPLAAALVSISVMVLLSVVVAVVYFKVKRKTKQLDKYGETLHESLKQDDLNPTGVVYTTVDFRAQQKPAKLYANLTTRETRAEASDWSAERAGMVEYSTLAVHR